MDSQYSNGKEEQMNKKKTLIISIILVILIIILVGFIINKKGKKKTENQYSYNILTEAEREEGRLKNIESIAENLKDGGLNVTDKKDCKSLFIDEEGYSYKINDQTIEFYELDNMKLESLIERTEGSMKVKVKGQKGLPLTALCFNNMLIFNSEKDVEQKIIDILGQK